MGYGVNVWGMVIEMYLFLFLADFIIHFLKQIFHLKKENLKRQESNTPLQ